MLCCAMLSLITRSLYRPRFLLAASTRSTFRSTHSLPALCRPRRCQNRRQRRTRDQRKQAAKDAEAYTDVFYTTGGVQDSLVENVNKAIRGEVDAKTALKTAQDQMNKKLKALGE